MSRSSRWSLTFGLITYQRHVVRRTGSVAIGTDQLHYSSDLLLNGSVIAALMLDQFAGLMGRGRNFRNADRPLAVVGRMDECRATRSTNSWTANGRPSEREDFLAAAKQYPELAGLHDLRTRSSGTHYFAQFHVWVPAEWTVQEAHDRLDRVEEELQRRFPDTEILIHVDPEGQTDRETLLPQEITEQAT